MPFGTTANPEQLAIMTDALNVYCRDRALPPDSPERGEAAGQIMSLFERGVTTREEILAHLTRRYPRSNLAAGAYSPAAPAPETRKQQAQD